MISKWFIAFLFLGNAKLSEQQSCANNKRSFRIEYCPQSKSNECPSALEDCTVKTWLCRNNYPGSSVQYHCCPTGCNLTATCQRPAVYQRVCPLADMLLLCKDVPVIKNCTTDSDCAGEELCCATNNCGSKGCRTHREIDCATSDCSFWGGQ